MMDSEEEEEQTALVCDNGKIGIKLFGLETITYRLEKEILSNSG